MTGANLPGETASDPPGSDPIRILLADDHAIFRASLRMILGGHAGVTICGEAADGHAAVTEALRLLPDVVLMDLNLPGLTGVEATREIKRRAPAVQVLMLSSFGTRANVRSSLQAGAAGFLVKQGVVEELFEAFRALRDGEKYFSRTLAESVELDELLAEADASKGASGLDLLTPREIEVLRLVCEGHSAKQISAKLGISSKTVEAHKAHIMGKVGVKNRVQLFAFALEWGIVGSNRPEDESGIAPVQPGTS